MYQVEITGRVADQKQILNLLRLRVEEVFEEYTNSKIRFKYVMEICCLNYKLGLTGSYIKISGFKGRKGLESKYRIFTEGRSEIIKTMKLVRGVLYVNGSRCSMKFFPIDIAQCWGKLIKSVNNFCAIKLELNKYMESPNLKKEGVIEMYDKFCSEYFKSWEELKYYVHKFNSVGGSFIQYYKLIATINVDRRLKNPFLSVNGLSYKIVSGGNLKTGARYTKSIKNISKSGRSDKLTRDVIRKCGLRRFSKNYLVCSKDVESTNLNHRKLNSVAINLMRLINGK